MFPCVLLFYSRIFGILSEITLNDDQPMGALKQVKDPTWPVVQGPISSSMLF